MDTNILPQGSGPGLIVVTGIFLMFFMSMVLLLFFYFSKKKIVEKELEKKNLELQYQQELIEATLEVQEQERTRIAQDLHDDISCKLNILSLNTHLLTSVPMSEQETEEVKNTITGMAAKALESSRRIAHDLLPPVLDKFGLEAGLAELCKECSSKTVAVNFENTAGLNGMEKNRQLHVYRIVQELINNSLKHGKATAINVVMGQNEDMAQCTYSDNGKGFDARDIRNMKGLGLKNINSRILFLGGTLTINSAVDKGTTILFTFK